MTSNNFNAALEAVRGWYEDDSQDNSELEFAMVGA